MRRKKNADPVNYSPDGTEQQGAAEVERMVDEALEALADGSGLSDRDKKACRAAVSEEPGCQSPQEAVEAGGTQGRHDLSDTIAQAAFWFVALRLVEKALSRVRNLPPEADEEELRHDVLLRLVELREEFTAPGVRRYAYVKAVTRHVLQERWRGHYRTRTVSLFRRDGPRDAFDPEPLTERGAAALTAAAEIALATEPAAAEEAGCREMVTEMRAALQNLPHHQRWALLLAYWLDWPDAEIARVMRWTLPAVKGLLWRGRRNVARILASHYGLSAEDSRNTPQLFGWGRHYLSDKARAGGLFFFTDMCPMSGSEQGMFSTGELAVLLAVPLHTLKRVLTLDLAQPPRKVGGKYLILREDLPAIRAALAARERRRQGSAGGKEGGRHRE